MVKFCWDIDDVAYVKLNRQVSLGKKPLTQDMKSQIEYLNWADLHLYKHFNSKLDIEGKVGCVFSMVVVSILPHAEFGPNDHQKDAPHFNILL